MIGHIPLTPLQPALALANLVHMFEAQRNQEAITTDSGSVAGATHPMHLLVRINVHRMRARPLHWNGGGQATGLDIALALMPPSPGLLNYNPMNVVDPGKRDRCDIAIEDEQRI